MRKIVITTDSNSDLPLDYIRDNDIKIISHYYEIDGKMYGEDNLLSDHEFYDRMRKGSMPITMASNPAVIRDVFTANCENGCDTLHISFSSELSCGCNNVTVGAREVLEQYPGFKIYVFDSLNVSYAQGLMIMKAVEMRDAGKSLDDIVSWLENNKMNFCVRFTVDDLFHLKRGGRISATTAIVGTIAGIKPILYVDSEGKLVSYSKVRGRKKSMAALVDLMMESVGKYKENATVAVVHGDVSDDLEYLVSLVREKLPDAKILTNSISPSIGAHSGPGALGLCFMGEVR